MEGAFFPVRVLKKCGIIAVGKCDLAHDNRLAKAGSYTQRRLTHHLVEAPASVCQQSDSYVIIPRPGGIRTEFLRFIAETGSDRREVFGGILLCAPRPIQRYMDHRDRTSFTEARSSSMFFCLFVCLFVTLIFRILRKATGQSFRPVKLKFFFGKVQGPT